MGDTSIEWTNKTWNAIRGCTRVSEGCRNCYAEGVAYRFSGAGQAYEGLVRIGADGKRRREWNGQVKFIEQHLLDPLKWKEPQRVFVNSMSDLFHENVTDEMRDKIFAVMALCPQHTFQCLTKRPERMLAYFHGINDSPDAVQRAIRACHFAEEARRGRPARADFEAIESIPRGLPNVWLGVSCENQATADERIPLLLKTPAAVRFISAEPLLGLIDVIRWTRIAWQCSGCREYFANPYRKTCPSCGREYYWSGSHAFNPRGGQIGTGLNWVIAGGESGPGARPMHPDWARGLRDQCAAAGVPFFFKQWGAWAPGECVEKNHGIVDTATWFGGRFGFERENLANSEGHVDDEPDLYRIGKKLAGALLDGREWREFPA